MVAQGNAMLISVCGTVAAPTAPRIATPALLGATGAAADSDAASVSYAVSE
jgi:hypothetical protein